MQNDPDTLIRRIEGLERKARRPTWTLYGLGALVLTLVAETEVAASKAIVLDANQFILKDAGGTKRSPRFT
jgi:hypothetical protein